MSSWRSSVPAAVIVLATLAPLASADDAMSSVKALYASASYEAALTALKDATPAADPVQIEVYRAMCLIALDRRDEAAQALERVVEKKPDYLLDESAVSPRVVSLFQEVRQRALPIATRRTYEQAKERFDHRQFAAASDGFREVLQLVSQVDKGQDPLLGDLKQLAEGFLKLSDGAAAAESPKPETKATPAAATAANERREIFGAADADVMPPVAVNEKMPDWRPPQGMADMTFRGTLEIVVDETGAVQSAVVVRPTFPPYDATLVAAARKWRYQPASRNGQPVKYRRAVAVVLHPAG